MRRGGNSKTTEEDTAVEVSVAVEQDIAQMVVEAVRTRLAAVSERSAVQFADLKGAVCR